MNNPNILNMLQQAGSPDKLYEMLLQNNPKFKQFVEQTKGMTPDDIAKKYNVNLGSLGSLIKK